MSTITLVLIICLFILIVLSGFLSGSETALTATSKPRILLKFKKGNKRAGYVLKILNNLDNVISSLLLSNNLVNILASSLATAVLYDIFGVSGIFYATLIMTILIVIFAEILPYKKSALSLVCIRVDVYWKPPKFSFLASIINFPSSIKAFSCL